MKYIVKTTNSILPISEEELPKVIKAMDMKGIVILKAGVVSGAFISSVERDIHAEKGFNYGYVLTGEDGISRKDYITDIPEKMAEYKNLLGHVKLLK